MLDALNNLGKQRVAAIDLQNIYAHLVVARPSRNDYYNQVILEKLSALDSFDKLKESLSKEKIGLVSYLASGSETLVEALLITLSEANIENCKRNLGIHNTPHVTDYFNFPCNSSLLAALTIKTSKSVSETLSEMSKKSTKLINQSDIALGNFYCKIYPHADKSRTAILTVGSEHTSLLVIDKLTPTCAGAIKFESTQTKTISTSNSSEPGEVPATATALSTATSLFNEAIKCVREDSKSYSEEGIYSTTDFDLVLLAGECDDVFLQALRRSFNNRSVKINVGSIEFFNPLIYNYVNIDSLEEREKQLIESEGHKFAAVIAGAAMALEFAGVDLSVEQTTLYKDFNRNVCFYAPQSYSLKVLETGLKVTQTVTETVRKAVASQVLVFVLALITAAGLVGYNYYQTTQKLASLENSILKEQTAIESLKEVEAQYKEHKKKIDIQKSRVETIKQIQTTQLTIPTIVKVLQSAQYPLNGLMKFNTVQVSGREINISGESIDKRETISFLKQLSDTGAFLDLNPTYDSNDSVKCRYSVTTKYSGPVQANQIKLPISNTYELAPTVIKEPNPKAIQSVQPNQVNQVSQN